MKEIKVKSVKITKFRNLHNVEVELNEKSLLVYGRNAIGKTNFINAIYWCLTGYSLNNSNDDYQNIPKDISPYEEIKIDVSVKLNVGTIRRYIVNKDYKLSTHLEIDNQEYTVKQGEANIDKMLGILNLTLKDNSSVKARKMLLNPMYVFSIAPSDLREWLYDICDLENVEKETYATLSDEKRAKLEVYNQGVVYSPTALLKLVKDDKKHLKESANYWSIVADYLSKFEEGNLDAILRANNESQKYSTKAIICDNATAIINEYALELSKRYTEYCYNYTAPIKFTFLEKNNTDDNYNLVCRGALDNAGDFRSLSTSYTILAGIRLSVALAEKLVDVRLPLVFDESEVFDSKTFAGHKKSVKTQFISSKVADTNDEILNFDLI